MVNKIGSENKTPYLFTTLGAAVGTIGGSKFGMNTAQKYLTKNLLPADEYIQKRVSELTETATQKFPADKLSEIKKNLPKLAEMEYEIGIKKVKSNFKSAFAIIGGVLLASLGFVISKSMAKRNKGPELLSSLNETSGLCGYNSTTAKTQERRYSSTTA